MSENGNGRKSASDVSRERALLRDAVPAVIALVVVEAAVKLLDSRSGSEGLATGWWLLPLLPAGWLLWAQWRGLRRADEYQRLQQLGAMAVGFGVMLILSLTGGWLDAAGSGDPAQWLQITFIGGVLSWLLALGVTTWRGR